MDYIREELLRQRNAWAALLRSGQRTEAETSETRSGIAESGLAEPAAESSQAHGRYEAEKVLLAAQRRLWPARQTRAARGRGGDAAEDMAAAGWAGGAELAGMTARPGLQGLRPESGREQGAKELSRLIERDSRRYDGGFALY
ncbi:MAG: hypothetical protein IJ396_02520 [Oscillibacter sp.]|nr:hypothetical protein [Oscillibacter sp.]